MNYRFTSPDFVSPVKSADILNTSKPGNSPDSALTFKTGKVKKVFNSMLDKKDFTLFAGTVLDTEGTQITARSLFFPYLTYLPETNDIATIFNLRQATIENNETTILTNKVPFYCIYQTKGIEETVKRFEKEDKYDSPQSGDLFMFGKAGQVIKFSKEGNAHIETKNSLLLIRADVTEKKERQYPLSERIKKYSSIKLLTDLEKKGLFSLEGKKMIILSTSKQFSITKEEHIIFADKGLFLIGKDITSHTNNHYSYCAKFKIAKSIDGEVEPMVLGNKLKEFLGEMIDKIAMLQYYHSCINPMVITELKQKLDKILSKNCELY